MLWEAIRDILGMYILVALTVARQLLAFSQSGIFFSLESLVRYKLYIGRMSGSIVGVQ